MKNTHFTHEEHAPHRATPGSDNAAVPTADAPVDDESRYGISPISGMPYIKAIPGAPMITSEQVREWLADFP